MKVLLNQEQQTIYNNGGVAIGVRDSDYAKVKVQKNDNGEMCLVITSVSRVCTKVVPYRNNSGDLNLNAKETQEAIKEGTIKVYRSSGAQDDDGKTLTRKEQQQEGKALEYTVVCSHIDGRPVDNNPDNYTWHIMGNNASRLEPIK